MNNLVRPAGRARDWDVFGDFDDLMGGWFRSPAVLRRDRDLRRLRGGRGVRRGRRRGRGLFESRAGQPDGPGGHDRLGLGTLGMTAWKGHVAEISCRVPPPSPYESRES